jgi:Leucine-rich repeat (LRR) protein
MFLNGVNEIKLGDLGLSKRLFESLTKLRYLYLYENKLKRIDSNTFKGITKLEELWLSDNQIEEIDV